MAMAELGTMGCVSLLANDGPMAIMSACTQQPPSNKSGWCNVNERLAACDWQGGDGHDGGEDRSWSSDQEGLSFGVGKGGGGLMEHKNQQRLGDKRGGGRLSQCGNV